MKIADDQDILTSILIRLPLKPLIRFKLVSKQWCSLIATHHFRHLHTLHHRRLRRQPSLLLCLSDQNPGHHYLHLNPRTKKMVPYHFPQNLTHPSISSSTNGLLLLKIKNECHYVYNPTSRQSRKIDLQGFRSILGLTLAFDPSVSLHYKIICVTSTQRRSRVFMTHWWRFCVIHVYDAETGAWSRAGDPIRVPSDVDFTGGVYLNGCVHWPGMFFDVKEGVVRGYPQIDVTRNDKFYDTYVESCGYLHYVLHFPNRNAVMVYQLAIEHSGCSLKYRVDVDGVSEMVSVVGFVRGANEEDSVLVLHEAGKIMIYSFKDGKIEEIAGEELSEGSSGCSFQFVETLVHV